EKNYRENMTLEEAVRLSLKSLAAAIEGGLSPERVELATVDVKTRRFEKLSREAVAKYLTSLT
ncbi:MAG: hypothetical protein QXT74_02565, partial [Candidatus Nezhaarchaeales archaeon]